MFVRGLISGHLYEAIVWPEHLVNRDEELGDSKITKLWICRNNDNKTVFMFDKGRSIEDIDDNTVSIAKELCAKLSSLVFEGGLT